MNTALARRDLLENFKSSKDYREAFVYENVYTIVSFQLRALREQRGWSQKRFGREAKMAQERISILEDPNSETKPTLKTLLRIAASLDLGLEVRFVPLTRVLATSFGNHPAALQVPSFSEELQKMESNLEQSGAEDSENSVLSWDAVLRGGQTMVIECKAPLRRLTMPPFQMTGIEASQTASGFTGDGSLLEQADAPAREMKVHEMRTM